MLLNTSKTQYNTADVVSFSNYYPFGQVMPNRNGNSSSYKYGFNDMLKDDELKGNSNSYDFGARIYDPRLGRWLSVDPHVSKYPAVSGYNFALNSPLLYKDPNGKDAVVTIGPPDANGVRTITLSSNVYVTGKGLTNDQIKDKTKYIQEVWDAYYGSNTFKEGNDINGVKYHLQIKVEFIAATTDNMNNLPPSVSTLVKSDKSNSIETKAEGSQDINGNSSGLNHGDNVLLLGWEGTNVTIPETSQAQVKDSWDDDFTENFVFASMHETWHLLGLSDRYDAKFKGPRIPHEGYKVNNIMSGTGYELGQANINAMIQSSLNILADPKTLVNGIHTIYKYSTNGKALDDTDPNKKTADIESKEVKPK